METAFGKAVRDIGTVALEESTATSPPEDMVRVRALLTALQQDSSATLRLYRPQPTAAFSPRDTSHPQYQAVAAHLDAQGFTAAERGAGGQLAVYDRAALVIDLVSPHPDPRENTRERFRLFAAIIAKALSSAGLDARVGAVEGEYCPGDFSVNAEGRIKLAGLAQRVVKHGYHLGAVLSIAPSEKARAAVADAYRMFDIPFRPETFGAMTDLLPGVPAAEACRLVAGAIATELGATGITPV